LICYIETHIDDTNNIIFTQGFKKKIVYECDSSDMPW
jgi:hypothetical protein